MALTERLALIVDLDAKGAVQGLSNVGRAAEQQLGKTEDRLSKVGATMSKVGVGMVGAGAVIGGALFKAAQASEEAEASTRKLENSIANSASLAGHSAGEFTDLAKAIQKKTAADADDIIAGQAVLAQFKLTAAEIKGLTPLVVDLARKKGIDLTAASTAVAKAMSGQSGALKKAGVIIDETAFKTDHFTAVQDALKNSVGGFAEEEGKTFAGSLERVKNQLGDITEGVGKGAVDVFSSMLGPVGALSEKFSELDPQVQANVGKFGAISAGGLILGGTMLTVAGKVLSLKDTFTQLETTAPRTAKAIGLIGKAGLALAGLQLGGLIANSLVSPTARANLGELEKGLLDLTATGRASGELAKLTGKDFDKLGESISRIAAPGVARKAGQEVFGLLGSLTGIKTTTQQTKDRIDDLDQALTTLAAKSPQAAKDALAELKAQLDPKDYERLLPMLDSYRSALGGAAVDARLAGDATAGMGEDFDGAAESTDALTDSLQAVADKMRAQLDPLFGVQSALVSLESAQAAAATAAREHGAGSDEAKRANEAAAEAALNYQASLLGLEEKLKSGEVSLVQAKNTMQAWVTQGLITQGQADQVAASFAEIDRRAAALDGRTVYIDVVQRLQTQGSFAALDRETRSNLPAEPSQHRAAGGPVMKNRPYLVGENGPEVFVPSGNGRIDHTGEAAAGSALTINLTVTADSDTNGKRVAREAMRELRRQVRARGGDTQRVLGRAS